jgi:Na+-translocating ferredoxin:NAD+ oxidoreductase RNF subunit RnfB
VKKLVPYIKIVKKDKLSTILKKEEYDSFYTADEIDEMFSQVASYYIDLNKCRGCVICLRKCPVQAISGAKTQAHVIDQDKCIKCGTCFEACPSRIRAVEVSSGPGLRH